jgi:hypothetical protein
VGVVINLAKFLDNWKDFHDRSYEPTKYVIDFVEKMQELDGSPIVKNAVMVDINYYGDYGYEHTLTIKTSGEAYDYFLVVTFVEVDGDYILSTGLSVDDDSNCIVTNDWEIMKNLIVNAKSIEEIRIPDGLDVCIDGFYEFMRLSREDG